MPISSEHALRVEALLLELVDDGEHVARRHHDHAGLEVADQLDLARGHAAGDRDDRAAELLRAVVRAQPAGEQAVAVGVVQLVARPPAGRADRAGHDRGPGVDVALGVADDGRPAGGAGGGVDAADLVLRDGEHAERVVVAQVGLARGRELRQVGQLAAVVGVHAGGVEGGPVVRHVLVGVPQRPLQPLELQGAQLVDAHPLRGVERGGVGGRAQPPRRCVASSSIASAAPPWDRDGAARQLQTAWSVTNRAGGSAVKRGIANAPRRPHLCRAATWGTLITDRPVSYSLP